MHEAGKLDAPSGTSLRTARLMAEAPGSALRDAPGEQVSRGLAADHVRIHSVRLPGVVAHQEVLFGGDDEVLTLRHDSLSRRSFMSGVLLALRRAEQRPRDCRGAGEPPRLVRARTSHRPPSRSAP